MFGKSLNCWKCNHEFKAKDARFCPQCGAAVGGSHCDVLVIVDRSGSMASCHEATVAGFNRFLQEQKELPGSASMTVVQFDDAYERIIDRKPLGEISPVGKTAFLPRGGTALLDAIGRSLAIMESSVTDGSRCVVCIITDGAENASKECKREQVIDLIKRLESKGWGFIYLGASKESFACGAALGIQNVAQYSGTNRGTEKSYNAIHANVRSFRTHGAVAMNDGFADTASLLNDDSK